MHYLTTEPVRAMMPLALITDCEGPALLAEEKEFFKEIQPFGFILFQRHCQSPDQLRALVAELQDCVAHDAPIFIDQEGGRVARLRPPHWEEYPSAAAFGNIYAQMPFMAEQACYMNARLMADELLQMGITANCAPLVDLYFEQAHDIIGDRAFSDQPEAVIRLAKAQLWGLTDGGVLPVIKHIPGHGRALADSHYELPVVDAPLEELLRLDCVPFKALNNVPFAMTAHIVYTALDDKAPATLSPKVIRFIRREIGFEGLLMSDDISMKALSGALDAIAEQTLDAGCDLVLHCNGTLEERMLAAKGCRTLPMERYSLYRSIREAIATDEEVDRQQLRAERDMHLYPFA